MKPSEPEFVLRPAFEQRLRDIGKRCVHVVTNVKLARARRGSSPTLRSDAECAARVLAEGDRSFGVARRWPTLAARLRKLVADESAWVALDAEGYRVDGASARSSDG